jgi:hypothetical protein
MNELRFGQECRICFEDLKLLDQMRPLTSGKKAVHLQKIVPIMRMTILCSVLISFQIRLYNCSNSHLSTNLSRLK